MFAVIDFETTNLTEFRRATEVAIEVLDRDFQVVTRFESLVNPETEVYRESLGYSRLTIGEIESAPTFRDIWPEVSRLLSGNVLVMHNVEFDRQVLRNEFRQMDLQESLPPCICTLQAAKRTLSGRPKQGGYSLSRLAADLGLDASDAHRASADVRMTAELFRFLYSEDRELRLMCQALGDQVVVFPSNGHVAVSKPRERFVSGGADRSTLERTAKEIIANPKVMLLGEVCRTGELADQENVIKALLEIGFTLRDSETRKSSAFLIQGAKAGKRKVDKAVHYGRPVLSEQEALTVIDLIQKYQT